jgi:hypothetical protein
MTPAELARRLERSFGVLAAGRRGAVAHHQTLRATIDWSFQLLAEPEQRLLARLSVFAGGCTLEAAETICGGDGLDPDTVFELLAGLVARSLAVAEEHGPETRYRLLETIRQYGEERLKEVGETERWRARHAVYYASLLPRIRRQAHDRQAEVFWAVRLSAEQDNLLAAWAWAIDTANVDTAFRMLAGFAVRDLEQLSVVARWRGGPRVAGRGRTRGLPARPRGQRRLRVHPRGCDRHRGAMPPGGRGQRAPRQPGLAGRGDYLRRPIKHRIHTRARSQTPPASPNRPPTSREPEATSPTPPSSSASPRAATSS